VISLVQLQRERDPDLARLERERNELEVQRRFYDATGLVVPAHDFPLTHEDLAALRVRDHILRKSWRVEL
jgi:hypothetical protein